MGRIANLTSQVYCGVTWALKPNNRCQLDGVMNRCSTAHGGQVNNDGCLLSGLPQTETEKIVLVRHTLISSGILLGEGRRNLPTVPTARLEQHLVVVAGQGCRFPRVKGLPRRADGAVPLPGQ